MRFIRSALITLTLAGAATLAGTATASAQALPHIIVEPNRLMLGDNFTVTVACLSTDTAATVQPVAHGGNVVHLLSETGFPGVFHELFFVRDDFPLGPVRDPVTCEPSGLSGTLVFTVVASPTGRSEQPNQSAELIPEGAPETGDGVTSTATGGSFAAAGIALIGAGGLAGGAVVIRRRRRSGSPS